MPGGAGGGLRGAPESRLQPHSLEAHPGTAPRPRRLGQGAGTFLVALLLTALSVAWVVQAEVIALVTQITESVPPIPALAALLLLALANGIALRVRRRPLFPHATVVSIYAFLGIAIACMGPAIGRFILSNLTAPFYYASEENHFADLLRGMPGFLVPQDPRVIKGLFEGSRSGVPWGAWAVPLASWLLFLSLFWLTLLCLTLLVRDPWEKRERLTFPMVQLPLQILGEGRGRFFRNPVMWIGFGIAASYDLVNILHALNPVVPALGQQFQVGASFADKPWDALRDVVFYLRPEMIGLGYLVSLEVSFSVWFFYAVEMVERLVGRSLALDLPLYPFPQEQSLGAFLLLAGLLLWGLRGSLVRSGQSGAGTGPSLWPLAGAVAGFGAMVAWCGVAGLPLGVSLAYLGILLAVALVYARIRAETGVPLIWMFPYGLQSDFLLNVFGRDFLLAGGIGGLAVFQSMAFLSRGYFPALMASQVEALRLGDAVGVRPRRMLALVAVAAPAGLAIALVVLLSVYYRHGAAAVGLWGTWDAVPRFARMVGVLHAASEVSWPKAMASGAGFLVAGALVALRRVFLGFPLHPLGYAMATAYGNLVWGSFLVVWLLKWLVLRYGGRRLYAHLLPGFIGLALGHFFVAGVVWGAAGAYVPEALPGYQVWFG